MLMQTEIENQYKIDENCGFVSVSVVETELSNSSSTFRFPALLRFIISRAPNTQSRAELLRLSRGYALKLN